eukprot:UC1_evm1s1829
MVKQIYVLNAAADSDEMVASLAALVKAASNESLEGLPLLLLANHSDQSGALGLDDIRKLIDPAIFADREVIFKATSLQKPADVVASFEAFAKLYVATEDEGEEEQRP